MHAERYNLDAARGIAAREADERGILLYTGAV